jgi:hypothetical protein
MPIENALPAATTLAATDTLRVVRGGVSEQIALENFQPLIGGNGYQINSLGAGIDNLPSFLAYRAWHLANYQADPNFWGTIDLEDGATFDCSNNMVFLNLPNLIVEANGASLRNSITSSDPSGADHLAWWFGGLGYIDLITANMTAIGFNSTTSGNTCPINTANVGDTTVTVQTLANALKFTAGQYAIVSSMIATSGGSPPDMRFFDYVLVTGVNTGTGVITFAHTPLTHQHLQTLPANFKSGTFPCAAQIFPLPAGWGVRQKYRNLNVLQPTNFSSEYAIVGGLNVEFEGLQVPYLSASQLATGSGRDVVFTATSYSGEVVDKLVKQLELDTFEINATLTGGSGTGGHFTLRNGVFRGAYQATRGAVELDNLVFQGAVNFAGANNVVANNNSLVGGALTMQNNTTGQTITMTVDGTTITYASNVITIPYATINANPNSGVSQFLYSIWPGAIIDVVANDSGTQYTNGNFAVVESITDDATNVYLGVTSTYAGGTIPNGTIFLAPWLQSWQGGGNAGSPGDANAIPNGDLKTALGNNQVFLVAPVSGQTITFFSGLCRGKVKAIEVDVVKAYTGGGLAGLWLEVVQRDPTFQAFNERIDAKTAGQRLITPFVANGSAGADIIATSGIWTSRYTISLAGPLSNSAPPALSDDTSVLPIIRIAVELEDIGHLVRRQ